MSLMDLDVAIDPGTQDGAGIPVDHVPGHAVSAFRQADTGFLAFTVRSGERNQGLTVLLSFFIEGGITGGLFGGRDYSDKSCGRFNCLNSFANLSSNILG